MTELENKRFTLHPFGLNFIIRDNGKELTAKQIVDLLNENEQLKEDKQALIEFITIEFPKSHKTILKGVLE